jgi:hypothetical protein
MDGLFSLFGMLIAFAVFGWAVRERVKLFNWLKLSDNPMSDIVTRQEGLQRQHARLMLRRREIDWKMEDISKELDILVKGKSP